MTKCFSEACASLSGLTPYISWLNTAKSISVKKVEPELLKSIASVAFATNLRL